MHHNASSVEAWRARSRARVASQGWALDRLPFPGKRAGRSCPPFVLPPSLPIHLQTHTLPPAFQMHSQPLGTGCTSLAAFPAGAGLLPRGPSSQRGPSFPPRRVSHSTPVPPLASRQPGGDARPRAASPHPHPARADISRLQCTALWVQQRGETLQDNPRLEWRAAFPDGGGEEAAAGEEFLPLLCPNKSRLSPSSPLPVCRHSGGFLLPRSSTPRLGNSHGVAPPSWRTSLCH